MKALKALELIKKSKIEDLVKLLEDEVYLDSLKAKPDAKKRYNYMKRYFTYTSSARECLTKPCEIEFEGKQYTSFTNSWSLILTTEPIGEIELFDKENLKYPDVARLLRFDGVKRKFDFHKVIAEAKSKGYKLNKNEVGAGFKYLMLYDGAYYKISLIDISYGIIDDGELAITHHPDGEKMPMTIQTSLGFAMIMPVYMHDGEPDEEHIIIEVS